MVSPSNAAQVVAPAQKGAAACGLLAELCTLLMTEGVPADILGEIICTVGEIIRGCRSNQDAFGQVMAHGASPPRTALVVLLMSMVNEKQPFSLRCSVLYCVQEIFFFPKFAQYLSVVFLLGVGGGGDFLSVY